MYCQNSVTCNQSFSAALYARYDSCTMPLCSDAVVPSAKMDIIFVVNYHFGPKMVVSKLQKLQ